MKEVTAMYSMIKEDWERYEKRPQYRILHKYSMDGRGFVKIFAAFLSVAVVIFLLLPLPDIIKDSKNRKNASELKTLFPMDYHIDHAKYYYAITAHGYLTTVLVVFLIVTMDSLFIVVIQHSCILFSITGFRLKTTHILNEDILYRGDEWKTVNVLDFSAGKQEQVLQNIIRSILEYNRALEYSFLVQSTYSKALFFQVFLTIVCMSVSALEMLLNLDKPDVVVGMGIWLVSDEFHFFFLCLFGQRISDFSENVYYDSIKCVWYSFSSKSKVIYQFLIMNIMPRQLVAMKLMVLNMQTFQAMTRLAASYFTVLSSTM